jgi:hypothetical protein
MRLGRPRGAPCRTLAGAAVLAATAVLAGCTTHAAPAISAADLKEARQFPEFTVYWAGLTVDGEPLTAADNLANFVSGIGFALYYGDCEGRGTFHTAGCALPLKITTALYQPHTDASFGPLTTVTLRGVPAVVYHGGDDIEIYTDHQTIDIAADTPARARAAVRALEPFNRTPTASFPAFPQPYYHPDPTQQELDAEMGTGASGPTGPTGATGTTSDISPPPALEPTPAASS